MGFLSAFNKKPIGDLHHSVERLSALIAAHVERLEKQGGTLEERSLTLIARSPSAAAARALLVRAKDLERQQVSVRMIFARLAPFDLLTELAAGLNLIGQRDSKFIPVRLIKTPALLHAHEQLVLGTSGCWTGDMLRRSEENRNGLDLWEDGAAGSVRLADTAFNAIWTIAKPVPARILSGKSRSMAERAPLQHTIVAAGRVAENTPGVPGTSPATRH